MPPTVILVGDSQRRHAQKLIQNAPDNSVVTIRPAKRTLDQNAKLWAMLSDISTSKPEGRMHTTEVWKCLFMNACGHECQFEVGLNNKPFPVGFSSSRMTKEEMSDLVQFIYAYGAEHGVIWNEKVDHNE